MRLGVDVGGTFTDVVVEARHGLASIKVLTTHDAPERGVMAGVAAVIEQSGVDLAALDAVIHGTTLATNALIERRGARTAFVTTAGFRDVIETRTESRFEQYDLNIVLPAPLIERRDRYVVAERMGADGGPLVPLDERAAENLVDHLSGAGYEAVAVGFLHSYRNPSHERAFREILGRGLPEVAVSISSEVSPQMREFERFNTVCANAFVQPLMATYLRRLEEELQVVGARCPLFLMHSGGGLMSVESAVQFPVRLVESGPAGGAIFAADLAARHGLDRVLSYDMGGTTAKICLIDGQTPRTAKTFEVARTQRFAKGSGMPISIPVIEMIEIGAGGGSIASVDLLGQIRVGPSSAGSEPGPACYQRGGSEPTVTDADLVLGRLSADAFGSSDIELSSEAALAALLDRFGDFDGIEAAAGVSEVVDENMANAARVHAVENGKDVGRYTMVAFGGAAPLHAARLCDKLGLGAVLVPPAAGVGSAVGFLRAPFAYEAVRSHYLPIDGFDRVAAGSLLEEMTDEAVSFVSTGAEVDRDSVQVERWAYMRYAGQGWEIPVEVEGTTVDDGNVLALAFEKAYGEFFGRTIEGLAIEAVSWSVRAHVPVAPGAVLDPVQRRVQVETTATRQVHVVEGGSVIAMDAALIDRGTLSPGDTIHGPAVITEIQTTTLVLPTQRVTCLADRSLLIERTGR